MYNKKYHTIFLFFLLFLISANSCSMQKKYHSFKKKKEMKHKNESILKKMNTKIKKDKSAIVLHDIKEFYTSNYNFSPDFVKDWSIQTELKMPAIVDVVNDPFTVDKITKNEAFKKHEIFHTYTQFFQFLNKNLAVLQEKKRKHKEIDLLKNYEAYCAFIKQVEPWKNAFKEAYNFEVETTNDNIFRTKIVYQDLQTICNEVLLKALKLELEQRIKNASLNPSSYTLIETEYGTLCVGSQNDDIFPANCAFYFDFGGNDIYPSLKNTEKNPIMIVVDEAGNDIYGNGQEAIFSIENGIGFFQDSDGNDFYNGGDGSFSAIYGFGSFQDFAGDDIYIGGKHSLAAATMGVFRLQDLQGNDTYRSKEYSQAFAGPSGLGILNDKVGNDLYHCMGDEQHAPLAPEDYRSLGQGFAYGFRNSLGGGIAVLWDEEGNDHYDAGVYAQGVGYWYAVGALIDEKGNDAYNAIYYPQGSGIHLACGFLYDGEGEDHYYSKHGPGQGAGHDYGSGIFIDAAGNDTYSVEGGNGLGISNGVGIFLDYNGDDHYERQEEQNYGFANGSRGSGSVGIFADFAGKDSYPVASVKNDSIWMRGKFGLGLDFEENEKEEKKREKEIVQVGADFDSTAVISEIFAIASEWEVNQNKARVRNARKIIIAREEETISYILDSKLGTLNGLEFRALKEFFKNTNHNDKLRQHLSVSDSLVVKNCIALLASNKDMESVPIFLKMLEKGKYKQHILAGLGKYNNEEAILILSQYTTDVDEKIRVTIARSLRSMDDPKAWDILQAMEKDKSFLIRSLIKIAKEAKQKSKTKSMK